MIFLAGCTNSSGNSAAPAITSGPSAIVSISEDENGIVSIYITNPLSVSQDYLAAVDFYDNKGVVISEQATYFPEADPGATVRGQIIAPDDAVTYKLLGVDTKIGDTTYKVDYEMAVTAAPTPAPTLSSGDQAAINKMVEMNNYLSPLMTTFSNAAQSGDYATERSTAVSINDYIGENLPEMTQLASSATTQQAVTQEYVSSLEDLQTGMNEVIHAIDDYNSGDTAGATTLMNAAAQNIQDGTQHLQNVNADLTPN